MIIAPFELAGLSFVIGNKERQSPACSGLRFSFAHHIGLALGLRLWRITPSGRLPVLKCLANHSLVLHRPPDQFGLHEQRLIAGLGERGPLPGHS